jgi:tetratricopeptide (TPR) repeat protein
LYAAGGYGKSALAARVYQNATGFEKLWANFQEPARFDTFARWVIQQVIGEEKYALVRELYERDSADELVIKSLNVLRETRCLLVLDNLETLFQSSELWRPYGEFLARWLETGNDGTILLTSQYRLELPTAAWRWEALTGLTDLQGMALLKAQNIEGSEEDLAAFVKATDGHPLMLQLAASWLQRSQLAHHEPAAIYRVQRDDVSLLYELKESHRGDSEACVGEILDRSFAQIDPGWLQQVLWRSSVLRRRFGLDVAQAMVDETVTLAEMRKLAQWSFLQEERVGGDWWFEFLPLIQRYLQQGAREKGELEIGHGRSIAYFWNRRQPWTGEFEDCRAELETFYHLCELKQYAEAQQVMDTCVEILERQGYYAKLTPIYEQLTQEWQPSNEEEVRNLGGAWTRLGNLYLSLGQYGAAIAAHEKAQALFLEISDRGGETASLGSLGIVYRSLGQYQRAIEFLQQSLDIAREIGDRRGETYSLGNLGNAYDSLGQYQRAIELYQQSLDIAREIGDRGGEANSLGSLGNAYNSLGHYQRAIEFLQQCLDIKREIGDRCGEANSLGNLGNAYNSLGHYQRAIEFYQQSLDIAREIGDRRGEATSLISLGNAYAHIKQYGKAIDLQEKSLAVRHELGDRHGEAQSLQSLAQLYQACGRVKEGFAAGQAAALIFQELNLPLEAWTLPKWVKSFIKFAQQGKWHLVICFVAGFFTFPFLLTFILMLTLWRFTFGRFRH